MPTKKRKAVTWTMAEIKAAWDRCSQDYVDSEWREISYWTIGVHATQLKQALKRIARERKKK